jgi:hypothetical protein
MGEVQIRTAPAVADSSRKPPFIQFLSALWTTGWVVLFVFLATAVFRHWESLIGGLVQTPQPTATYPAPATLEKTATQTGVVAR